MPRKSNPPARDDTGASAPRRLLNDREAAAYLGVSRSQVRYLIANGDIPRVALPAGDGTARSLRRLLIDPVDLDRLIERWKQRAAGSGQPGAIGDRAVRMVRAK